MSNRKLLTAVGLVLLCITCLFFWRVIFLGETTVAADILYQWQPWKSYISDLKTPHNYYWTDAITLFYSLRFYATEMMRKFQIPLWDPYIFCGIPFLANPESAIFTPFSAVFYFLPFNKAFAYSNILQLFFAGFFMFLFMRTVKAGYFGSFIASLVFMFNGFSIVWLEDQNPASTTLWLPFILLFIEKMICEPQRYIFVMVAAVSIGLGLLGGSIQFSLYILLAVAIYAVVRILQVYPQKENRNVLHCFFSLGMAFVLGFGLAAIQLIPFSELVSISQRVGGLYKYNFRLIDISAPLHLITFIIPGIYGNSIDNNYWGAGDYGELCGYIGILPLILAILAIFSQKRKLIIPFLAIAIFSLLVYLRTPVMALLYLIPGYNSTLSAGRIIFLYVFSASVLAGFGAEYLEKEKALKFKVRTLNKFIIKCLFTGAFLFLSGNFALQIGKDYIVNRGRSITDIPLSFYGEPNFGIMARSFLKNFSGYYAGYLHYYHLLSPAIYIPFILIFAGIWIFTLYLKKGASIFLKTVLCLIIMADLFYFGMRYLTMADPKIIYPEIEAVQFLKKDSGIWRAGSSNDTFPPNTMVPYKIQSINGAGPFILKRYVEFMRLIDKGISSQPLFPNHVLLSEYNSALIDALNVKYILTKQKLGGNKFKLIYDKEIRIYENAKAFPRAFLVPEAIVIKEKEKILKYLSKDDLDLSKYVILEEEPQAAHIYPISLNTSKTNITDYSPHSISIETTLPDQGFLVLSDSYYPGWKAYVDSRQEKIFCANYIMRAVYLNKGQHKVDFIYDPISFKIGRYISFLSIILVILSLVILLVKKFKLKKYNGNQT